MESASCFITVTARNLPSPFYHTLLQSKVTSHLEGTFALISRTLCSTRTCYRTCFEGDECKAFATSTSPRGLRVEGESPYRFQRVFSPQSDDGIYRKSTICRFNLMFHSLSLSLCGVGYQDTHTHCSKFHSCIMHLTGSERCVSSIVKETVD